MNEMLDVVQAAPLSLPPGSLASLQAALPPPFLSSPVTSPTPITSAGHNPPCSTLFVANLANQVSEQELKEVFSR